MWYAGEVWNVLEPFEQKELGDIVKTRTRGIADYFWNEDEWQCDRGIVTGFPPQEKDTFLRALTQLINLNEVQEEWPYVDWHEILIDAWECETVGETLTEILDTPNLYCSVLKIEECVEEFYPRAREIGLEPGYGITGQIISDPQVDIRIIKGIAWEVSRNAWVLRAKRIILTIVPNTSERVDLLVL